jgi:hypothetical protein
MVKRVLDDRAIVSLKYRGLSQFHPSSTANIAALAVHYLDVDGKPRPQCRRSRLPNRARDRRSCREGDEPRLGSHPIGRRGVDWSGRRDSVERPAPDRARHVGIIGAGYQPAVAYAAAMPDLVEAAVSETALCDWRDVYPGLASYATGITRTRRIEKALATLRDSESAGRAAARGKAAAST